MRSRHFLVTAFLLTLFGCTTLTTSDAPPPTGYSLTTDSVVFEFKAWKFAYATNGQTGRWIPLLPMAKGAIGS